MFHAVFATPVVIVRIFMTYGPGQNRAKVIPHIICSLLRGESPRLSSGDRQIDWIYNRHSHSSIKSLRSRSVAASWIFSNAMPDLSAMSRRL